MYECVTEERFAAVDSDPALNYEAFWDRLTPGIGKLAHREALNTADVALRCGACQLCAIYFVGVLLGIRLEHAWHEEQELAALAASPAGERP